MNSSMNLWRSDNLFFFIIMASLAPLRGLAFLGAERLMRVILLHSRVCFRSEYIIEHWFLSIGLCTNVPKIGVNSPLAFAVTTPLGLSNRNTQAGELPEARYALCLLAWLSCRPPSHCEYSTDWTGYRYLYPIPPEGTLP